MAKQQLWDLILNHSLSTEFASGIKQEIIQYVLGSGRILQELGRYEEAKDHFKVALVLSKVHDGGQSVNFGACLTEVRFIKSLNSGLN